MAFIQAVGRCIWRVLRNGFGGVGAITSGAGTLGQVLGRKILIPSWVWILIGAALLFVTAVKIEMELLEEQRLNRKPQPDLRLEDAVRRVTGLQVIQPLKTNAVKETAEAVSMALDQIREKLNLAMLIAFGRPGSVSRGDERHNPLTAIPPDRWNKHRLDYLSFLGDHRGSVEDYQSQVIFTDIYFDDAQFSQIWPKKWLPRLSIRWPVSFNREQ